MNIRFKHPSPFDSRGVSLLIVIIILGAALLIVGTGALVVGLGEREEGFTIDRGGEARALVDGCMDEAYLRLRREGSWGSEGSILFTAPNGSCTITVSDLGGGVRQIDVLGTADSNTFHFRSNYSLVGAVPVIESWEERID